MAHQVFISYAVEDRRIADAVCATLEARGIGCWIAPRDVLPGKNYAEAIIQAIRQSRVMVLILSAHSNHSAPVAREVERAADSEIDILTFRTEPVAPSPRLEFFISATHWLDALEPPLETHLNRLARTVELLLGPAEDRPAASVKPKPREEARVVHEEVHKGREDREARAAPPPEPLRRAVLPFAAMPRALARAGRAALRVLASAAGLPWSGLRTGAAALRGGGARVRKFLAQAAGGGFRRIPPALRYIVGGGAILAVGLGCYGIYEAITSDHGVLFPPTVTATPGPALAAPSTARIVGKEFDRGDGIMLRSTFEVGPASRVKAVVRLPFRVRYEGEEPGCSGRWLSDNTSHQEAVDRGEAGIHLEGPSGEVSQLVCATGVGAADAVFECDIWYEGAWVFAPVGDYGTALVHYPNFEPIQIGLPGESSSSLAMPTYTVRDQDALALIAEYFGVSESDILSANQGLTATSVTTGRTLNIPVSQEEAESRELSYAALSLEDAGFNARATEAAFIALGLDADNGEAHFAMGVGLYQLGKANESLGPLHRAVDLRSRVAIYHSWLAAVLVDTGDASAARLEAEEALRLQPDEPIALSVLGALPTATPQPPPTETPTPTPIQAAFAGLVLDDVAGGGGAVIRDVVAGSAAEAAGLKVGDVITAIDGQAVSSGQAVADAITNKRPGDKITFTVRRDGQEEDVVVTLGERTGG